MNTFSFESIDEYYIVLPELYRKLANNPFQALVMNAFTQKSDEINSGIDDLLFCLIELVSLSDIKEKENTIGDTIVYSGWDNHKIHLFIQEYKKIIASVKEMNGSGISEYQDWYLRNSYLLQVSNEDLILDIKSNDYKEYNWEQPFDYRNEKRERENYGFRKENLTEDFIQDYLSRYAKKLNDDLGFKDFPHYAIIVKPISVKEGSRAVPLGNLYIHFATRRHYSKDFYMKLISDFQIVWQKKYGMKMIEEIKRKEQQEIREKEHPYYLPKFHNMDGQSVDKLNRQIKAKGIQSQWTLAGYYRNLFIDNPVNLVKFEEELEKIKQFWIPFFWECKQLIEVPSSKVELSALEFAKEFKNRNFWEVSSVNKLGNHFHIDTFITCLLKREWFKMGFLLLDIEPKYILETRLHKKFIIEPTSFRDNCKGYTNPLNNQLFIPYTDSENLKRRTELNKRRDKLLLLQSDYEQELFEGYQEVLNDYVNKPKSSNNTLTNLSNTSVKY